MSSHHTCCLVVVLGACSGSTNLADPDASPDAARGVVTIQAYTWYGQNLGGAQVAGYSPDGVLDAEVELDGAGFGELELTDGGSVVVTPLAGDVIAYVGLSPGDLVIGGTPATDVTTITVYAPEIGGTYMFCNVEGEEGGPPFTTFSAPQGSTTPVAVLATDVDDLPIAGMFEQVPIDQASYTMNDAWQPAAEVQLSATGAAPEASVMLAVAHLVPGLGPCFRRSLPTQGATLVAGMPGTLMMANAYVDDAAHQWSVYGVTEPGADLALDVAGLDDFTIADAEFVDGELTWRGFVGEPSSPVLLAAQLGVLAGGALRTWHVIARVDGETVSLPVPADASVTIQAVELQRYGDEALRAERLRGQFDGTPAMGWASPGDTLTVTQGS